MTTKLEGRTKMSKSARVDRAYIIGQALAMEALLAHMALTPFTEDDWWSARAVEKAARFDVPLDMSVYNSAAKKGWNAVARSPELAKHNGLSAIV